MDYIPVKIPLEFRGDNFSGDYINKFDKGTAKKYFHWYMSQKNERILILEKAVRSTRGFENWKADLSLDSLSKLQKWFEISVGKRETTSDEKQKYKSNLPEQIRESEPPLEWVIDEKTNSLCHDVGIYFAEVLIKDNPDLHWGQDLTSKTSVDRNHPIVVGRGRFQLNPYTIVHVTAIKKMEGRANDWVEIYNIWSNDAKMKMKSEVKN